VFYCDALPACRPVGTPDALRAHPVCESGVQSVRTMFGLSMLVRHFLSRERARDSCHGIVSCSTLRRSPTCDGPDREELKILTEQCASARPWWCCVFQGESALEGDPARVCWC
jgi:hypothetical protein